MEFQTEYKNRTDEIEQVITAYLPKEEGYQKTVMEAMNYSFLAGGETAAPHADVGDLPSFRRGNKGDRAFYGGNGNDTHLFPGT